MLVGSKDCEVFTWLLSGDSPARKMMGFGSLDLPPENRPPARRGRWALTPPGTPLRTTPAGGAWENRAMELTYYGRSCVRIRGREATIAYDPYTSIVGPTGRGITADIVTLSHPDDAPLARVKGRLAPRDGRTPIATSLDNAVVLEGPGEYEVKSVLITGIRSYRDSHRGGAGPLAARSVRPGSRSRCFGGKPLPGRETR